MNNTIVTKEDIFNNILIQEESYLKDLLNEAILNNFLSTDEAEYIANICIENAAASVEEFCEDEYLSAKERDLMLKNNIKIIEYYLISMKHTEAIEILKNSLPKIMILARNWYDKLNSEAYAKAKKAYEVFKAINHFPATKFVEQVMKMYSYFASKLMSISIDTFSIHDINIETPVNVTEFELMYHEMNRDYSKYNSGFFHYIEICQSLEYESELLKNLNPKDIKDLVLKTLRNETIEEEFDGKKVILSSVEVANNVTMVAFYQLLVSFNFHKNVKEPLNLTNDEGKRFIIEAFNDYLDIDEMFEELNKIQWYNILSEEVKNFFNRFKPDLEIKINNLKKFHRNDICAIF